MSANLELYPAYILWLGLISLITAAILYRRLHGGGWMGDSTASLPLFFLIVLSVSTALADYGWLPVLNYLVVGGLLLTLVYGNNVETTPPKIFKILMGIYLILVSATVLASLSEARLLSPPLLISLPALAVIVSILKRKNITLTLGILILILGLTAGSSVESIGGNLLQLTASQDTLWIIIILAYLVYVSSAANTLTKSITTISSIPILASLILAGLGAIITPVAGISIPQQSGTSAQPLQTLPLILSFAVLGGWRWIDRVNSTRVISWAGIFTALLASSLILVSASDDVLDGFQTGAATVLAPIFGDFAKPLIGRIYGVVLALSGLVILTSAFSYLVGELGVSKGWSGRQAVGAILLIPFFMMAVLGGWREILPYAGGINMILWSILTLGVGVKPGLKTVISLGIFIYAASTLIWLSLTRLASLENLETLYTSITPILGIAASGLGAWTVIKQVGNLLGRRRSIY